MKVDYLTYNAQKSKIYETLDLMDTRIDKEIPAIRRKME